MTLVYVYKHASASLDPSLLKTAVPDDLLLPPLITNRQGWLRGWFKTVASKPLEPSEILPRHTFAKLNGKFRDEGGQEVREPSEPVGPGGVVSYYLIAKWVSEALPFSEQPDVWRIHDGRGTYGDGVGRRSD